MIKILLKKMFLISCLVIAFGVIQVVECASKKPLLIQDGVAQMFIDDYLIESSITLERTLHQPKKDNDGNFPIIELGDEYGKDGATLEANGTIVYDPKIKRYVMFAMGFTITRQDWDRTRIYRFTSEDGMNWIKGDDGSPEQVYPNNSDELFDPVSGKRATYIDMFSCYYDKSDNKYPYKGWLWFSNWGDELEGIHLLISSDGKTWKREKQIIDGYAGKDDPTCHEIRQDGWVVRGASDVTLFYHDDVENRFLGLFKFLAPKEVDYGNRQRSRAYMFIDRIDVPLDLERGIRHIEFLPPVAKIDGNMPYDEFYASTAWRYESLWLGGLKVWHRRGDYPYSAAGCAFFKLAVSRDGLSWDKVQFKNDSGIPEVFIPNGPEGGNSGHNDGGYMTEFSQGPLRIGDQLIYYYGATSWGKNFPNWMRLSGGGIFRARLRPDGFVSVDKGNFRTKLLEFKGNNLYVNSVGHIKIEILDEDSKSLGSTNLNGDSFRHEVTFNGKSLGELVPSGKAHLHFTVSDHGSGSLYSFTIK
jgi:hypothetical protein